MFTIDGLQTAKRRLSGWYDTSLVTKEGEGIFADLDNYAINLFRKKGLLFSERRDKGASIEGFSAAEGTGLAGYFEFDNVDAYRLKLFGLSLLWRAAATKLPDFSHIALGAKESQALRSILTQQTTAKHFEYTVVFGAFDDLYQWSDRNPDNIRMLNSNFVRWCVDGVIVYAAKRRRLWGSANLGRLSAGFESSKIVGLVHKYEDSHQKRQSDQVIVEHVAKFGVPYKSADLHSDYPEYEFDENGNRIKRTM